MGDVVELRPAMPERPIITPEERGLLLGMVAWRMGYRDTALLKDIWVEGKVIAGQACFTLVACFGNPPDAPFLIDSAHTFAPLGAYNDVEHARGAGSIIAGHYRVPLVDYTQPETAA